MAISSSDADAAVIAYDQLHGIEFPSISAVEGGGDAINSTYQIQAYPTYILVAPDSSIVEQDIWPVSSAATLINVVESYGIQAAPCGPNSATDVIQFSITEQLVPASIGTGTVGIDVLTGTPLNALIPTFSISSGAWAEIGGVVQESGVSVVDFSAGPVTYTINAEDSVSTQDWVVTITESMGIETIALEGLEIFPNPANDYFSLTDQNIDRLTITNHLGKIVKVLTQPRGNINISDLATGIYQVQLQKGNSCTGQKLVKIK